MMNIKETYRGFPRWFIEGLEKVQARESTKTWPRASQEIWRRTQLNRLPLDSLYKNDGRQTPPPHASKGSWQRPSGKDRHIKLLPLSSAIELDYPGVRELLEPAMDRADNPFQGELLRQIHRGVYLHIPRSYRTSDPLFLEDRIPGNTRESFSLNLVVLQEGAQADLWERISQEGETSLVHNRSTLFLLEEGSRLNYYRTQSLDASSSLMDFSAVLQKKESRFWSYQAESEIHFNKSHLRAELQGPGSQAELRGIYALDNQGFQEIFTEQIHQAPHCQSHSNFRGVLNGRSRAVYNGLIQVSPQGEGTDAYLNNKHLLLGDQCRADSIPGLKIETHQVKCSHGSTSGKIQPDQLFYLQSRGFDPQESRDMITRAFLEEIFAPAPAMVKEELHRGWGLQWEVQP